MANRCNEWIVSDYAMSVIEVRAWAGGGGTCSSKLTSTSEIYLVTLK